LSVYSNEPMIEVYIMETNQILDTLEQVIMDLEKSGDLSHAINEIFRHMHTIKGNSMMMMYDQVAELAHTLEDLFDYLRKNPEISPNFKVLTDLVLEALDFMKEEVESLSTKGAMTGQADGLRESIKEFLDSLQFMNPEAETPNTPLVPSDQNTLLHLQVLGLLKNKNHKMRKIFIFL